MCTQKGKRGDRAAIDSCFTEGGYTGIKCSWQNVPLSRGSFITFNPNKNKSLPKKVFEPYTIRTCVDKTLHSSRTIRLTAPACSVSARKQTQQWKYKINAAARVVGNSMCVARRGRWWDVGLCSKDGPESPFAPSPSPACGGTGLWSCHDRLFQNRTLRRGKVKRTPQPIPK